MDIVIPPLLTAVQTLRLGLGSGRSTREVFRNYLDENNDELAAQYRELWIAENARASVEHRPRGPRGTYARAFWQLAQRGFAGEPISKALLALEDEVQRAARAEIDAFVSTLPFKMMIPLLLLQFPALLLLLLGPLIADLTHATGAS